MSDEPQVPLRKAVSSYISTVNTREFDKINWTREWEDVTRIFRLNGNVRFYEWCYGIPARLTLKRYRDRIPLTVDDEIELARLLEESEEPFDPNLDFFEMKVAPDSDYLGKKLCQLQEIQGYPWGTYGISVFRRVFERGDKKMIIYIRYDSGRGMDEREAYDCMIPLTETQVAQLVRDLRNHGGASQRRAPNSRRVRLYHDDFSSLFDDTEDLTPYTSKWGDFTAFTGKL